MESAAFTREQDLEICKAGILFGNYTRGLHLRMMTIGGFGSNIAAMVERFEHLKSLNAPVYQVALMLAAEELNEVPASTIDLTMEDKGGRTPEAITQNDLMEEGDEENCHPTCPICMEVAAENTVITKCGHFFCAPCIFNQLCQPILNQHQRSHTCPMCRSPLEGSGAVQCLPPSITVGYILNITREINRNRRQGE